MELAIEWRPACDPPQQLIVLLHGEGARADSMRPLAQALRRAFPSAAVLAPEAPLQGDDGACWWTASAVPGAGPDEGLDPALAAFHAWVGATQDRLRVGPAATALAGFAQGAMLALEFAARYDGAAGRVLAFGGRFAQLPGQAPQETTLHLLHGADDARVDVVHARRALAHLGGLGGDATLDVAAGVGHALHAALIDAALHRLRSHIPQRTWRAALGAAPPPRSQTH